MAVYYAEIKHTTILTVRVEVDDEHEPTDEDVFAAAAYVDNHVDSWSSEGTVIGIEYDDVVTAEE